MSRLELTWSNKEQRLLAHGDDTYEWVDPADWRVSEVRLLQWVGEVGEVGDGEGGNLLIQGDALHALTALASLPDLSAQFLGKIKLCYIDPPFNTGQAFQHYDDAVEHSVWLTMLRDRLVQIRQLLRSDGSVWVHLDDAEVHRARCVLDEVFGADCYAGTVMWRNSDNSNNDAKRFSEDHNTVLVYSRRPEWRTNRLAPTAAQSSHFGNPDGDPRGPWFDGNPVNSPNPRANLRYELESPTGYKIPPPPNGWRWAPATMEAKIRTGEIRFTPDGKGIRRRTYLMDHEGLPPSSLWIDLEQTGHSRQAKSELKALFPGVPTSELFSTPKPERFMKRVIEVASSPGDIVLDCYAGSGTTAAVAHKLGRRWITVELSPSNVESVTLPRLKAVVEGERGGVSAEVVETPVADLPDGVSPKDVRDAAKVLSALLDHEAIERDDKLDELALRDVVKRLRRSARVTKEARELWVGGGGFRIAEVGPSMFEADDDGTVYLAEWATGGDLAEAVCAQLGYRFELERPFAGRKGRSRLAVIDGLLTAAVVRHLVEQLGEDETLMAVAQALEPGVEELVRELRRGSRARKVPRDLARAGVLPSRLVRLGETADGEKA